MTVLEVTVPGVPVPQGSMKSVGPGRMVHSNGATLMPWRGTVAASVQWAMHEHPVSGWPLTGPVAVSLEFSLPRPKSAPKSRWAPDKKPDVDKLCRAALDGLTDSGAIQDDAQVVSLTAVKVYGEPHMRLTLRGVSA